MYSSSFFIYSVLNVYIWSRAIIVFTYVRITVHRHLIATPYLFHTAHTTPDIPRDHHTLPVPHIPHDSRHPTWSPHPTCSTHDAIHPTWSPHPTCSTQPTRLHTSHVGGVRGIITHRQVAHQVLTVAARVATCLVPCNTQEVMIHQLYSFRMV
jgi:hypothetical protein